MLIWLLWAGNFVNGTGAFTASDRMALFRTGRAGAQRWRRAFRGWARDFGTGLELAIDKVQVMV